MTGRITPERFRQIEALFEATMALDPQARDAHLAAVAQVDTTLAEAVRALLAAEEEDNVDGRLEAGIGQAMGEMASGRASIGPFVLERVIGAGGMGVVYEAVQDAPIQRRVALKLLRIGDGGHETLLRFRAEAQALARLNHANVAQVFEVGSSNRGEPYLVMELIDGMPLTAYCNEHLLPLGRRVELLIAVCRGVQHAHQRGIVHRDLKPANVLVSEVDGRAVPKIIDFGIAKSLVADVQQPTLTRAGEALGTLQYMSPEQTRGSSNADIRSDVYALGAMLYEVLAGELPVPREMLDACDLDAACRAIREHPPRRPSRVIAEREDAGVSWPIRARSLHGELDWIVLKALEKEPDRRYGTVSELAADLERYLHGDPVQAGPPSASYRLRKLVWRHRWAVAAVGLLLVSLLIASAGLAVGLMHARQAEAAARLEAETSQHVSDFLVRIFEASDPREGGGAQTPVGEVVGRAADTLDDLELEPVVRSRLLDALGKVYGNLGLFDLARAQYEQALVLREAVLGPDAPEVASILADLGSIYRRLDLPDASESAYRRALVIQESHPKTAPMVLAETLNGLAVLVRVRAPDEAHALYRRSLRLVEEDEGAEHPNVVRLRVNLATLDARAGRFEAASEAFGSALMLADRVLEPDHPDLGGMLGNYAFVERKLGRYRHSRALLERALAIEHARLGEDHPLTGYTLINLLAVCQLLGDLEAAEHYGDAALRVLGAALPPHHSLLATARNNHAATLLRLGRPDRAVELAEMSRAAVVDRDETEARLVWLRSTLMRSQAERRAHRFDAALGLAEEVLARIEEGSGGQVLLGDALWARAFALAAAAQPSATGAAEAARTEQGDDVAQPVEEARFAALSGNGESAFEQLRRAVDTVPVDAGWLDDPELVQVLDADQRQILRERVLGRLEADAQSSGPPATP